MNCSWERVDQAAVLDHQYNQGFSDENMNYGQGWEDRGMGVEGIHSTGQGQELANNRKVWLGKTGYGEKLFLKNIYINQAKRIIKYHF